MSDKNKPTPGYNDNCLEGWCCPECGNEDRFQVVALSVFELTDAGSGDHADVEYDEGSYAYCAECDLAGTVATFTQFTQVEKL